MARHQITADRLRLFNAIKSAKKEFDDVSIINLLEDIKDKIKQDSNSHYLSISQDDFAKVSYAKSKKDKLNNEKRIKTTFGRYLRRNLNICKQELNDTNLSKLSDYITLTIGQKKTDIKDNQIKELKGDDIVDFYIKTDNTLHTCMTGKGKSDYVKFYALNPDKVSLITTMDNKARALLWITDNGEKVLDKIYPNFGSGYNKIKVWAFINKIKKPKLSHRITMKYKGYFPYLDCFKYGKIDNIENARNRKKGTVVLSCNEKYGNASFLNTIGSFLEVYRCEKCENKLDYYGTHTYIEKNRTIKVCSKCYKKYNTRCIYCNFYIPNNRINTINNHPVIDNFIVKGKICSSCITKLNSYNSKCFICNNNISSYLKCLRVSFHNIGKNKNICFGCLDKIRGCD